MSHQDNDNSCNQTPTRADFEKFLENALNEIKKPPTVHEATSLLAQELANSDNLWCREIRDYELNKRHATIQWTSQQDADLVALSLAHMSSAHDMRKIETYRSIKAQFLTGNPSAEDLRCRLIYLCHERNKIKLENLCGYVNSDVELTEEQKKINENIKKGVRRLRAAVLRLEDVDRWDLMSDMTYYLEKKKRIGSCEKKHLTSKLKKNRDNEYQWEI